ncbi:MAG: patatin-like phospholipase family protein, partial [Polyangiaceae bacterium]
AGIATGQLAYAAAVAEDLWLNHGAWNDVAHFSLGDWFRAEGLLDTSNLIQMVKQGIEQVVRAAPRLACKDARVTLITTRLKAMKEEPGSLPVYEQPVRFEGADFLDHNKWVEIATAAAASATFPGVFAPTMVGGVACVDGGAVNNAPISCVLDDDVRQVIVITSESCDPEAQAPSGGADLFGKLADILINERISHDLEAAKKPNSLLADVISALEATGATAETKARVLGVLGWRHLDLVLVHPCPALAGTAFSAFFDRGLRQAYIDAGKAAAKAAISAHGKISRSL